MTGMLGARWVEVKGRPTGFGFLRVGLSIAVILIHSAAICNDLAFDHLLWGGALRPFAYGILPCFFALSGFLVAGSLERNDLVSFLTLRVIRIFPALVVEVLVAALLIGPLFTVLPLSQYFSDALFYKYFLNTLGDIQYVLPGVFLDLPGGRLINLQLWTVPYELKCYVLLSVAALLGLTRRHLAFLLVTFCGVLWMISQQRIGFVELSNDSSALGPLLVVSFLLGVIMYLARHSIPLAVPLFAASVIAFAAMMYLPVNAMLVAIPIVYLTVYIGVLNPRADYLAVLGNYSYGLYLYGYPVQQAVSALLPEWRVWYIHFPLSLALTLILAAFSWHFVESKVMSYRKPILRFVSGVAARLVSAVARLLPHRVGEGVVSAVSGRLGTT